MKCFFAVQPLLVAALPILVAARGKIIKYVGCAGDTSSTPTEDEDRMLSGRLYIVNGSGEDILLASNSSGIGVTEWNFADIPHDVDSPQTTRRVFNITFDSKHQPYYEAKARFTIGGSEDNSFVISSELCSGSTTLPRNEGPCLKVEWSLDEVYAVAPQKDIAFRPNASIDLVIVKAEYAQHAPRAGAQWMKLGAAVIADLSILEISWPCTHDSGTYAPKLPFVDLYATTQYTTILEQLMDGVRVLDLRVGWYEGLWVITHGQFVMSYTVLSAVIEVKTFIDNFPEEFVILDFHNLNHLPGEDEPDRAVLKAHIRDVLGDYHLDHDTSSGLTISAPLRDLWNASQTSNRRILLSWNTDPAQFGEAEPWMWPRIDQKWFSTVQTVEELYGNLTVWWGASPDGVLAPELYPEQSATLPSYPRDTFHSTCTFSNSLLPLAAQSKLLEDSIVEWFHGTDFWSMNANIISVNFVPHSNDVVQACVAANLVKGHNKRHGIPIHYLPLEVYNRV